VPFTESEKVKIRHHMGYLNVAASATFVLGSPAALETTFLIETAMNKVLPEAESMVRLHLGRMDLLEQQLVDNAEATVAKKIGDIEINEKEYEKVVQRYRFWQNALANLLGTYPNPWDKRFANAGVNVPVHH